MRASARAFVIQFAPRPPYSTGTVMPTADVRRILDTGYLVVLDEAYFEFADADGQGFETMIGEVAVMTAETSVFASSGP